MTHFSSLRKLGAFALVLTLHTTGCMDGADEPMATSDDAIVDEPAAFEGVDFGPDEVVLADTPPGVAPDNVVDSPEGAPAVGGELNVLPYRGVPGNFTGGDVTPLDAVQAPDPDAETRAATALALMPAPEAAAASCPDKFLDVQQVGQQKGYWCGPASGYMILSYMHRKLGYSSNSKKNNASLSQKNIASSSHMKTEANHGTPWTSKNFVNGINAWLGDPRFGQVPHPSGSLMKSALVHAISTNKHPLAADTVELAGGVHYNGHPSSRTIGHWIVAYGYKSCGGKAYFADPSTTVFSSAAAKFSYDSASFASRFLQNNGIAY